MTPSDRDDLQESFNRLLESVGSSQSNPAANRAVAQTGTATPASTTVTTVTAPAPGTAEWRKQRPLHSGVLAYFPDALLEVAHTSWVGNEQHNPGTDLHWDRSKSQDELDALARHLLQPEELDSDGVLHAAKVAWRALANLQKLCEKRKNGNRS